MKIGDVEITHSPIALNPWRATLGDISVSGRTQGQAVYAMIEALERQTQMLPVDAQRAQFREPAVRLAR